MSKLDAARVHRLAEIAARAKYDPLLWAELAFPWGVPGTPLEKEDIRVWQADVFGVIADHLADPATRYQPCRIAVASGHGIGKSAAMSILGNWAMSCHRRARVLVTANTEGQLRTKTSPEFAKWFRMSLSAPLFDIDTLRIAVADEAARDQWRLDFTPWSITNTEAFQGLHNLGRLVMILVDEGSAIPDLVYDVMDGAMTDENTILIQIVFGNPTMNTGRFREFFRRYRNLMTYTAQIDSRTVEGTNRKYLDELVAAHGEDSDYVRVRVRGQFPSSSDRQFIPTDLVEAARERHLEKHQYDFAPVILTCDPAWTGGDELVIGMRQGLVFRILDVIRSNNNDVLVAQKLAAYEDRYDAAAVFIDAGYGTGIKSAGDTMGRSWELIWFASSPIDPGYANKRSEMWALTREWLREGGAIPDDQVLFDDLIGPETLPRLDGKVALETKEHMRKRQLPSPNRADALALSFARPVQRPLGRYSREAGPVVLQETFDPHGVLP